jgi:hypothetical protein
MGGDTQNNKATPLIICAFISLIMVTVYTTNELRQSLSTESDRVTHLYSIQTHSLYTFSHDPVQIRDFVKVMYDYYPTVRELSEKIKTLVPPEDHLYAMARIMFMLFPLNLPTEHNTVIGAFLYAKQNHYHLKNRPTIPVHLIMHYMTHKNIRPVHIITEPYGKHKRFIFVTIPTDEIRSYTTTTLTSIHNNIDGTYPSYRDIDTLTYEFMYKQSIIMSYQI